MGSFDNNNTGKGKHIKGAKNNNKGKGKSTSSTSTSKCWVSGKLGHRAASCWYNNPKNINNVQQQQIPPQQLLSSFSFRAHQISPSLTCLQQASLRSTSSRYLSSNNNLNFSISRYDRHYLLHRIIRHESVHTRTSHLRHQFHQQHVRL